MAPWLLTLQIRPENPSGNGWNSHSHGKRKERADNLCGIMKKGFNIRSISHNPMPKLHSISWASTVARIAIPYNIKIPKNDTISCWVRGVKSCGSFYILYRLNKLFEIPCRNKFKNKPFCRYCSEVCISHCKKWRNLFFYFVDNHSRQEKLCL